MSGHTSSKRNRKRRLRIAIGWVAFILILPVAADALYAALMRLRIRQWEKTLVRDEYGIRSGAIPFQCGEGNTAILFVPGFAAPPALFRFFAEVLDPEFSCHAMRLPGKGEPIDRMREVRQEEWKDAVLREARALNQIYEQVWLVGHSMGAAVILNVIREDPGLADGIVLVNPLIRVSDERSPFLPARTWFDVVRRVSIFTDVVELHMPLDAELEEAHELDDRDRFIPESLYAELFALIDRLHSAPAGTFDGSVMMVIAPRDRVVDNPAAERYLADLEAPVRKVFYDYASGHVIPIDAGRETVAEEIRRFVLGK